ncbi:MAG: arginine N-succinyltransferase [Phycisphaerales bacterium]
MFRIRRAKIDDVGTLLKLAKMVHFINLPADRDIITNKVMRSREGFLKALALASGQPQPADPEPELLTEARRAASEPSVSASHNGVASDAPASVAGSAPPSRHPRAHQDGLVSLLQSSDLFMFVLEDLTVADEKGNAGAVLGTSQIITRMGGPGRPNVSFRLSRKETFSSTLQVGATHIVAKLHLDETGPTEIGGLILQPSYRGHKLRLGRLLSLVRFHVMGLYRPLFSERVLAEMMGPMTPDGRNTMWEYLGRRFINLTYAEADSFCQYSKEFMTSLLPHEEIYLTLLPPEARAVIAQVGPETVPARRMLEKLGFAYRDHIDPFDGGPHLEAATDDISIVKNTRSGSGITPVPQRQCDKHGLVSVLGSDGDFRAIETDFCVDRKGRVGLTKPQLKLLGVLDFANETGVQIGYTDMPTSQRVQPVRRRARSRTR